MRAAMVDRPDTEQLRAAAAIAQGANDVVVVPGWIAWAPSGPSSPPSARTCTTR